jgi:hypothetical protein
MLHVVTVHWRSATWIDPQLHYLGLHTPADTRVYASLDGLEEDHSDRFHYSTELDGTHAQKLDILAGVVAESANDDDLLLFIDGDAFPIAAVDAEVLQGLSLAAVRREENLGDQQPHPCFCLTTVGFWKQINGTWTEGYKWKNTRGEMVTDVGGNLLGILRENDTAWRPLLRSNRTELHPLWFGVYADLVYHHGAGFRERIARLDGSDLSLEHAINSAILPKSVPYFGQLERSIRMRRAQARRDAWRASVGTEQNRLAEEVFASLLVDDHFYRVLLEPTSDRD